MEKYNMTLESSMLRPQTKRKRGQAEELAVNSFCFLIVDTM